VRCLKGYRGLSDDLADGGQIGGKPNIPFQPLGETLGLDVLADQVDGSIVQASAVQEANEPLVMKRKNGAHLGEELVRNTGACGCIGRQEDDVHDLTGAGILSRVHIGKRPRNGRAYDAAVANLCSDHETYRDH